MICREDWQEWAKAFGAEYEGIQSHGHWRLIKYIRNEMPYCTWYNGQGEHRSNSQSDVCLEAGSKKFVSLREEIGRREGKYFQSGDLHAQVLRAVKVGLLEVIVGFVADQDLKD